MERRVVITGMGVITPVGCSVDEFWANLQAGHCGIAPLEGIEEELSVSVGGQVKNFDPAAHGLDRGESRRSDRYSQFAVAAAIEAMAQSGLQAGENIDPARLGVYIGSGIGGMTTFVDQTRVLFEEGARRISPLFIPMMISNIASGNVAIRFNAQGPSLAAVSACATSTTAAGEAFRAIKHGYADAILTGGSEATVNALAIGGFANSKALSLSSDPHFASIPFNKFRIGVVMDVGAGILVFEDLELALERGAEIIAEVVGYGNTCEAYHYTPAPRCRPCIACDSSGAGGGWLPSGRAALCQCTRHLDPAQRQDRDAGPEAGSWRGGGVPCLDQLDQVDDGSHAGRYGCRGVDRLGPCREAWRSAPDHRARHPRRGVRPGLHAQRSPRP